MRINKLKNLNENKRKKRIKKRKNSKLSIVSILIIFILLISIFLLYSQTQKKYFEEANAFRDWIQFNTNGILILIGAMATITSVIMTIRHSDNVRNEIEFNKYRMDLCLLENELIKFFNYIENDLKYIEKNIIDLKNGFEKIHEKSPYNIKQEDVNNVIRLTLSAENLFVGMSEKKDFVGLRKDIIELYEIQKKVEAKGSIDKYLLDEKIKIYQKYFFDNYKKSFNKVKEDFFLMKEKFEYEKSEQFVEAIFNSVKDDSLINLVLKEIEKDVAYANLKKEHQELKLNLDTENKIDREKYNFIRELNAY